MKTILIPVNPSIPFVNPQTDQFRIKSGCNLIFRKGERAWGGRGGSEVRRDAYSLYIYPWFNFRLPQWEGVQHLSKTGEREREREREREMEGEEEEKKGEEEEREGRKVLLYHGGLNH